MRAGREASPVMDWLNEQINSVETGTGRLLGQLGEVRVRWPGVLGAVGVACTVLGFLFLDTQFDIEVNRLQDRISALNIRNRELRHQNDRLRYINDLAVEFSMDPTIIALIDHYSRQYVKKSEPEWRLLKTPEFMTYIMLSIIYAESKGNPAATGDGGKARGLSQIWVSTARQYGDVTARQLLDPETNISFSFRHFHHLLQKYRGNLALALYAWNRGSGTVDRLLDYGQSPQNGYGRKVYEAALLHNRQVLAGRSPSE